MSATMNVIDFIFIGIILISAVIGVVRGATREILGVLGWGGALVGSFVGMPFVHPFVLTFIENPLLADLVSALALFLVFLIIFTLISKAISGRIKRSVLGGVDRSMGLLFGLLRGGMVLCLTYLLVAFVWAPSTWPSLFQTAKTAGFVRHGAEWLQGFIPLKMLKKIGIDAPPLKNEERMTLSSNRLVYDLAQPKPKAKTSKTPKERGSLDRLIQGL